MEIRANNRAVQVLSSVEAHPSGISLLEIAPAAAAKLSKKVGASTTSPQTAGPAMHR